MLALEVLWEVGERVLEEVSEGSGRRALAVFDVLAFAYLPDCCTHFCSR